jgi:membrane-associated phospholipid phosphatase
MESTIMIKTFNNRFIFFNLIIISCAIIGLVKPIYPQFSGSDSSFHPYHVNYWATGGIIIGGITAELIGLPWISNKSPISTAELQNLDRQDISPIDRWALNFNPAYMGYFENLSTQLQAVFVLLPVLTMLDHNIRQDWLDVLMMYLQTQIITNNVYLYSPFGPTFQNRFRPVVYYDALGNSGVRTIGTDRSSFYSGHVAASAAASFFAAKVYCDYHPELECNKYLIYSAAAIPPLIMGYVRLRALAHFPTDILVGLGVGASCGILIPEFHRIQDRNISLGLFSSPEATGLAITWNTNFLN